MAKMMILEPDERLCERMCKLLTHAGHECLSARTAADGLAAVQDGQRLLTVINARLPWVDSFALLGALQQKGWPVLFITRDENNAAHLKALYRSGCDVLSSPFDGKMLVDAVERLLHVSDRVLTLGPLQLDVEEKQATLNGEVLALTAQEFALLQALMESPDSALTREQLLRTAWGYQGIGETRTVDVHIQRLRRKIGSASIETVYKLGYRLKMA